MSRCWPTAETAWRTAGSDGRCSPRPSADQPAAMAPEVTTTTVWPSARAAAISPPRRRHRLGVTDDEPTLTTAITTSSQVNVMSPTVTSSPSRAPARARARSTPSRRRRRTASACAPSSVRSDRATARSAARPSTSQAPGPARCTSTPSGTRAVHDDLRLAPRQPPRPAPRATSAASRADEARTPSPVAAEITRSQTPSSSAPRSALAAHHQPRPLEQLGLGRRPSSSSSTRQLRRRRRARGERRAQVEQHDEDPGALDVAQEAVPEALALGGPLDQPRDVGHDELGPVARAPDADDAEVRLQRGERVVGDLRLGGRDGRDQRRLAGVGEARPARRRP